MQLSSGEHSILAYFPNSTAAQDAVQALKAAGVSEVQIDRVSRFGVNNDSQYNNPIAGQAETQTGLILFSADTDRFNDNDARILLGADPSVEGYAPPGYGIAGGKSFLVTVVTDDAKLNEATSILKDRGAYF
jgi:hypothetical protein